MKMTVVEGFRTDFISTWSENYIKAGSHVISDKLPCFKGVVTGSEAIYESNVGAA